MPCTICFLKPLTPLRLFTAGVFTPPNPELCTAQKPTHCFAIAVYIPVATHVATRTAFANPPIRVYYWELLCDTLCTATLLVIRGGNYNYWINRLERMQLEAGLCVSRGSWCDIFGDTAMGLSSWICVLLLLLVLVVSASCASLSGEVLYGLNWTHSSVGV